MTDRKHKTTTGGGKGEATQAAAGRVAAPGAAAAAAQGAPTGPEAAPAAAEAAAADAALAAALAERDDYLDHLRRLKAEFENYRKRVQRDNEELRLRAAEAVVESLLPVMDNMDRALEAADRHEEGTLRAGLQLVAGQLRGTLEGHGLEEIPVEPGTIFDPTVHEAVLTQPSDDYPDGSVLQVLERGYLLHGGLLRPAKVIVVQ